MFLKTNLGYLSKIALKNMQLPALILVGPLGKFATMLQVQFIIFCAQQECYEGMKNLKRYD